MAPSSTRRMSWRVVAPVVAIAAFGLTACSNSEEPSSVPGTTPPVWTGAADPSAHESAGGHGSETAHAGASAETVTATLNGTDGAKVGTVTFAQEGSDVKVTLDAKGLTPGFHGFHVHQVAKCETNSVAPSGGEPGNFGSGPRRRHRHAGHHNRRVHRRRTGRKRWNIRHDPRRCGQLRQHPDALRAGTGSADARHR
jgi:Cu-Zn family superoxide dismutase